MTLATSMDYDELINHNFNSSPLKITILKKGLGWVPGSDGYKTIRKGSVGKVLRIKPGKYRDRQFGYEGVKLAVEIKGEEWELGVIRVDLEYSVRDHERD